MIDVALAVAVFAALAVGIWANAGGQREPDLLAYGWAVGLGGLMFARRHYPRIVLVVTILGAIAYFAAGYPAIPLSLLVAAPLFSAAERRHEWFAVGGALGYVLVSIVARLAEGDNPAFVLGYELVSHLALMGGAILLGVMVRLRREAVDARDRIEALQARERELHAEQRIREERIAIAKELHDSIGHSLTLVSIHANVADATLGVDEAKAREALANVKRAASGSLRELRSTVGLLRSDGSPSARASADQLERLLDAARTAGMATTLDWRMDDAPDYLETAAYRIAQEAVANAVRHARGTRLDVSAVLADEEVRVRVVNDGAIATPGPPGAGIAGMRERAEALGGRLTAERQGDEFVVAATIPAGAA